jgi:hypothetical protein
MDKLGHMATRIVAAPALRAFAYLSDPLKLGRWSLGCFGTFLDEHSGLHAGRSLFDDTQGWFHIDAEPGRFLIDYRVGTPGDLCFRISARVAPGESIGYTPGSCLVMLTAWRPAEMTPERWQRLCASHESELWLIKAQIEREYQGEEPPH